MAQTPATAPGATPAAAPAKTSTTAPAGDLVLATGPYGTTITYNDVLAETQRSPDGVRQNLMSRPDAIAQLVNNLLVRRALAKEAERDGLHKEPLIAANIAIASDRALSDARLARLDAQNAPNAAALETYAKNSYQANPAKFDMPAQSRARHILLPNQGADSLAKANALLAQLRAGASFEDLAKANSIDPGSAVKGGDLGFFSAGQMVRPFDDAVNKLAKPGDLSEPVETQFGYHIIRLEERREKGRQTYEQARPQLLDEARTAILNQARVLKVQSLNKEMALNKEAVESLATPGPR